jgi:enediyne biosynthesis protein E4
LGEQFSSFKQFSESNLDQFLGPRKALTRQVKATTLESTVFLNLGGSFRPIPLPREAQLAPGWSVNVADFDNDGFEDLFMSQNFFALRPDLPRIDAGTGLWLKGDGTGNFSPMSAAESGISVHGEQRGAALGDFDRDGRVDVVVTQNGAETKLFRNTAAKAGLRVRLKGLPSNPQGIGAVLRVQFSGKEGAAREIHGGSGHWSQDSLSQVMAIPARPASLWIRWPGGRITTTPLPDRSKEVLIDSEGKLANESGL